MKKVLIILALALLILPTILAIDVSVEKLSSNESWAYGSDDLVEFQFKITNNGPTDNFQIYNLLGFDMDTDGLVKIERGKSKIVNLLLTPRKDFDVTGYFTLPYYIRGEDESEMPAKLTFKIITLEDAFILGTDEIDPESENSVLRIYLQNKENVAFKDLSVKLSSTFFEKNEVISFAPRERVDLEIQLDKDEFKKLSAGFYTLKAEISSDVDVGEIEATIKFVEKDILETKERDYGFVIATTTIEKENQGNTKQKIETVIKKNLISRLFTYFEPEPDLTLRQGLGVIYTWEEELSPGESLDVTVKTNWLFPLLIMIFLGLIVYFAKKYSDKDLVLRKRVSFVKSKGGEFALKVTIAINAKKYIERVSVIDRLPGLVKVYERFGGEKPFRVDEQNKRIEWSFEKLEKDEIRMLTYIIYSKVGVLGKFALPETTAIYEKEGNIIESKSNKCFFVAEQRKGDSSDE